MTSILLRGSFLTNSGYAQHSRMIARWILERNSVDNVFIETLNWGNTPWILDKTQHNGLIDKIIQHCVPLKDKVDVSFQIQLPNEWNPQLAKYNVGITAGIETDRCNSVWIEACNKMNAIVVPSQHAKQSLINVGKINIPIYVIPESYPDVLADSTENNVFDFSTDFNFLVFGQLTGNNPENDRKNLFYTLKWMFEEFKNDKDVGIILKTNAGRNSKFDRQQVVDLIKKLINDIRKTPFPKVHLIHGSLSEQDVKSLYKHNTTKAFLTATRGEGFGLPILEAAVCDLPIIAPNWSGYVDFLNKGKFIKLPYNIRPIHQSRVDNNLFMQGSQWCEATEDGFKKAVRKFYNASEEPKKWANELGQQLRESHSFATINNIYESTFKDILCG